MMGEMETATSFGFLGLALSAVVIYIAIKYDLLSLIYDMHISPDGIRFVFFSSMSAYFLKFEDIQYIEKVNRWHIQMNSISFKNRFFSQKFLIALNKGWYAKKIMVTPKDPASFVRACSEAGVEVRNAYAGL